MFDLCKHPLEPPKKYNKMFCSDFVTYEIKGKYLSKFDYQKSVKSKMAANDSRRRKLL